MIEFTFALEWWLDEKFAKGCQWALAEEDPLEMINVNLINTGANEWKSLIEILIQGYADWYLNFTCTCW